MNNNQEKSFWQKLNTEQNVRYALLLVVGLFGGWIISNFYSAMLIYPYIGQRYDPNGNGDTNGTTTTTMTTIPIGNGHYVFVAYTEEPHIGKTLIYGGVGSRPVTQIYFRMQIRETNGVGGTCYVHCSVKTTTGNEMGGVGSVQIGASQTIDHSFTFTINSADYDLIDWGTISVTFVTG